MKYILFFVGLFFLSSNLKGQNQYYRLDSLYTKLHKDGAFNGNVLVAEHGKIIFEKSYGLANERTKEKLSPTSIFNLASVSKQFTAVAIVLLNKQGKLSYDDPIDKYIPELSFYKDISIRNLLTHTSGLPDYMPLMEEKWDHSKIASNNDVIALLAKYQPAVLFPPNNEFRYSNTGYVLLASIIERVTKQSFGKFLQEHIFSPCQMTSTSVIIRHKHKTPIKNLTIGYLQDSLGKKIQPELTKDGQIAVYLDGVYGPGRVYSTARDLLKWDRVLATDKLVSAAEKEVMYAPQVLNNKKKSEYGFGWMLDHNNKLYGSYVYHDGGWAGYVTFLDRHLTNDKTLIVLQNNDSEKTEIGVKSARKIIYNQPVENPIVLDSLVQKKYAGTYKDLQNKSSLIVYESGKLYVQMNPQVKIQLIPLSKSRFIVKGFAPDVIYEFISDELGTVKKFRMQQKETGIDKQSERVY